MSRRDRDPDAVAALQALPGADSWHAARAALPRAKVEGQPLELTEPDPGRRPACGATATAMTPVRTPLRHARGVRRGSSRERIRNGR